MNKRKNENTFVWGFTIFQLIICLGLAAALYSLAVQKGVLP